MTGIMLEAHDVHHSFTVSGGFLRPRSLLKAVNGIDLKVRQGDVYAIVGESGCGKTTLAKILMGLLAPSAGDIFLEGRPVVSLSRLEIARIVQPVFQDPYASLNPRKSIGSIITLPLHVLGTADPAERRRQVERTMDLVGLPKRVFNSYPSQLSGGQRQRVAIARAIICRPRMLICDEPTSALDVSVQAQILNLLQDLRREFGLTYIVISHDLAVVEHIADRVGVMNLGRIVEESGARTLFRAPQHPYAEALMQSVLTPEPGLGIPETHLGASYPNPMDPPPGCAFHPRCPRVLPHCARQAPPTVTTPEGHVECHLYDRPS